MAQIRWVGPGLVVLVHRMVHHSLIVLPAMVVVFGCVVCLELDGIADTSTLPLHGADILLCLICLFRLVQ